ncbi:NAD(P)-binding domain-containing protein [Siccirubricoccus sp. KC 17139]|uniref:L-threonate dehydrogenase n=1 Tax=Siccirubricoccus soli TaxID=2899147 RepID=A0ABT1D4Y3_9PROT|nr:L-threonate dehydrogenase [Siccirubricoccus soli]MCO6416687.1 NAD(P)-binding domain-containing protein [Siccirubricoccus soli]MCP2682822.1 NAD(P)-binding domain-containing protein [Siccirubricoccus soli]
MQVAVIGLGSMGMGAALNLVKAEGLSVAGVDLRDAARAEFAAAGGLPAASGAELPPGAEAVLVLVVNAVQAREALFGPLGAAPRLAPGAVLIVSSTMSPAEARALAAEAEARQFLYLDAPVSGGAAGARAGALTVMASGSAAAKAKAAPVLDAIAKKVWDLGEAPGLGATMKVVHQLLAGVHIAAAAEAMALGIKAGLDPETLYGVVTGAAGNSWMFENRMRHVLNGDETPRSAVDIFVKDLGLVTELARAEGFPALLAAQAQQLFTAASAMGHGGKDDGFVIRAYQALTGIRLPKD